MPRLQILQHKSYHPYLESNKQRVRDDEAKAAALEAEEERTALSENSTTRLEHLRNPTRIAAPSTTFREAGTDASALLAAHRSEKIKAERREEKKRLEYDWPKNEEKRRKRERDSQADSSSRQSERKQNSTTASGHINFWEGMEKPSKAKKTPDEIQADDPTTMYLDRPLRETKPWYTDPSLKSYDEREDDAERREKRERIKWVQSNRAFSNIAADQRHVTLCLNASMRAVLRRKEEFIKRSEDPMTHVQAALSSKETRSQSSHQQNLHYQSARRPISADHDPLLAARTNRESAERARALALISSARRQAASTSAGTSVAGWTPARSTRTNEDEEDLWNPQEVKEARRRREAVKGWRNGV